MTSGTGPGSPTAHSGVRVPRATLGYAAAKVLLYLLELHARGGGYRIRGMPGWAAAAGIERDTRTWGAGELLRVQARRGRVHAHDARAPGEARPTWLYRVAQPGADCLAESVGLWAAGVRDPRAGGDPHVLLREGPLRAWQALKLASNPYVPLTREWIADEPGWRSARELNALLVEADETAGRTTRCYWSEDMRWLVMRRFAEERVVDRTHVYRLTQAGAELRPLEWRDPCG